MISKADLERAIAECEDGDRSYTNCEKLSTFYNIYDHMYSQQKTVERLPETVIGNYGDSEFLRSVTGRRADDIWNIMDDLMSTLQVINPRLYAGVMRKVADE